MRARSIIAALAIIFGGTALSLAQPNVEGAVELSNGTKVPQKPSLPKLNLTNTQREQIRKAVLTEHNEVEFRLKATKAAKDFSPAVGATIPKAIAANAGSVANAGAARLFVRENEGPGGDRERHEQ
jgi:hypothetical protein